MLLKLSKFFLYASVFCVLIVMTSTFFPFIGGKDYFFRTAIQLSAIFLLLWWAFEAPDGELSARLKDMFKKPLVIAVSAFAFAFLLATLFAFDPRSAFWSNFERGEGGFQMLHYYALFFLSVFLLRDKKDWERMFWASIAAAVAMVLYGIGAAVFIVNPDTGAFSNPFGFVGPYTSSGKLSAPTFLGRLFSNVRFEGSLGNPAYVAPYLMFSLFYLLWLWFSSKGRTLVKNISYSILGIFFMVFFFLSGTRGAFVGLAAAVFAFLFIFALEYPKLRKYVLTGTAALAIVLGTLIYYSHTDFVKKLPGGRVFDIAISDKTLQTRLWTWNSAWKGFVEKPLLGWGPENFSAVFDKYFDPRHYVPGQQSETWFDYAHSIVFDYLAETGIIGFLSFVAIFAVFYFEWFKKMKGKNPILKALLAAMPFGYLVQGLALFNVLPIYISLFLFMAFACYEFYYSHDNHAAAPHHHSQ
ncbi:MAG TPA: O-antigen ligase family protein [Candidatus Paceibacterota bacterium]|nr:O-antigen ligase family protein [Candidatus Paceibacterota bacterium]